MLRVTSRDAAAPRGRRGERRGGRQHSLFYSRPPPQLRRRRDRSPRESFVDRFLHLFYLSHRADT